MLESLNNRNSLVEFYQSFFEYNPDATYAILPDGTFALFNESACKITGYTREEAIGMPFSKVIDPDYLDLTTFHFEEALKGGIESFQSVLLTNQGKRVSVSIKIVPVIVQGELKGIIGVTKDITEQLTTQALMHGQNRILEMVTKNKSFQTVLDSITLLFEGISRNGGKCSIMLMDEHLTKLTLGSAPNLSEEQIHFLNSINIGDNAGSCGTAAFSKNMIIVEDTQNHVLWEKYKEIARTHNIGSCWSIPLLDDHDHVLGTFSIYYEEACKPHERDLQILEEASYLSGIAIQHYKTKEKLKHMAFHDPLTGLPNRRLFSELVEKVLERSKQTLSTFCVLFIDLDRFKNINDTYGHEIGDLFLIEVAKRLKTCIRSNDVVARLGGDEFTILLENSTIEDTKNVGDRIVESLIPPFFIQGSEIFVTPSIGISAYPIHGQNSSTLLKKADAAMYRAKKAGGNNFKVHDADLENIEKERVLIENYLYKALENNELSLHYQPKIELSTNKIMGVEALIRWNNPDLGLVPPDKFIPIAENTGLIIPIGEWVVRKACEQLKVWNDEWLMDLTVAVNLSMRQFFQPNLVASIEGIIKETGINPCHLDLEITESMTMDIHTATKIIKELKALGVKISIDDFGTGYSSFNYLKHFPIDYLKIDKSFVNDITHNLQSETLVKIIFLMAKALGFKVVAEGVETQEQLDILNKLKCEEVQGYFFSKPLPTDEFESFFNQFEQ